MFSIVFLLLAALSSAVLADADPAPPPAPETPAEHLLLVPDNADGVLALAGVDARVVARYESFALVEAAGEDDRRLRAAGGERRDDMREVATAAGDIDPATDRGSLAGKHAPDRDEVLALVQFVGPPKNAWVERLRATGARVVTYQAQNAYVVHADGAAVDRLADLVGTDPAVRAVIPLGAADKVEGRAKAPARYAVSRVATIGGLRTQYLELSPGQVDELASDPAVVGIERDAPPVPNDERAAAVVAGLGSSAYLAWHDAVFPGSTPFDVTIDVTDSGLDNGAVSAHPDFHVGGSPVALDRVDYKDDYTADGNTVDCTGHGTNVASIAAGYNSTGGQNEDGAGFNYGLGIAPLAKLGVSKIFRCDGSGLALSTSDVADIASAASGAGADISNNSWGLGGVGFWGAYSARARAYDRVVRDAQPGLAGHQPLVEVFSAGNDGEPGYGTVNAEASAKNVITVGASEGTRTGNVLDGCGPLTESDSSSDIAPFSARGPTDDGRLKPDLVAPGTRVTGARPPAGSYDPEANELCSPFFGTSYSMASGTSQAAPQVSGAAALVRHWYLDNVSAGVPPSPAPPSPAMTKALLINTASDLAGGQNGKGDVVAAGPNPDQGWGRVNLGAAFDGTSREFYDQQPADIVNAGESVVRGFMVQNAAKPLKVTLVWTDPEGPAFGEAFVNDLDLEVAVGGRTYRGNVFAGGYSRTGGTADSRNNVESVYLPAGTSGPFAVTVRGTSINADGVPGNGDPMDQDFALVVSNADEQPAAVLVDGSAFVSGGDGDGVLESDEQVDLTEQVRNAGIGDATGVSAVLSGGAGLSVTQGSSMYPTIPEDDGVAPNDTPFGAHLANAATCGADVGATLAITSSAGTQAVPVVLPTGELGPVRSDSAAAPVAIPDNNAAGASSSLFVPDRGRIKDVDVTIAGIDHSAVGDLVIELTGPDGTTVRLADHPGGPDEEGDDFTNTTFNDDAPDNLSEGSPPYTGTFRPQNDQLSRFNGTSRRGTWSLRVRDLFQGDTGTLQGWGVATQKAVCDIDTTPPDTSITGAPANPSSSTSAQFSFGSNDGGATFECRLDGAAYEPCPATMTFGGLALGPHTVSARAIDGSDNEDATPATYAWLIEPEAPPTPAASFLLAPVEERLADALAGRYNVMAACASGCRVSATVSVSARTARRLHLGRKAVSLGSGAKRRGSAGTAKLSVHLSRKARAALRGRKLTKVTLKVTLTEGGAKLTVKRSVELRRSAGLQRIASRGLRLWAACARRCPLSAELTLSAAQARRLDLKLGRAKRYELASGRTTATRTPKVLVLKVRSSARKALARAHRVGALLEAVAGTAPNPLRTAKLSTTLRR